MTKYKVSLTFSLSTFKRSAYSRAAIGSLIEHGPITINKRLSLPSRILRTVSRPVKTVFNAASDNGSSALSCAGVIKV